MSGIVSGSADRQLICPVQLGTIDGPSLSCLTLQVGTVTTSLLILVWIDCHTQGVQPNSQTSRHTPTLFVQLLGQIQPITTNLCMTLYRCPYPHIYVSLLSLQLCARLFIESFLLPNQCPISNVHTQNFKPEPVPSHPSRLPRPAQTSTHAAYSPSVRLSVMSREPGPTGNIAVARWHLGQDRKWVPSEVFPRKRLGS